MDGNRFWIARKLMGREKDSRYIRVLFFLFLHTGMMIVYPFIYKYFIDEVLFRKDLAKLPFVIMAMLLWLVGAMLVAWQKKSAEKRFILLLSMRLKEKIFCRFLEGGPEDGSEREAGERRQVLEEDVKEAEEFWEKDIFDFILAVVTVICLVAVMALLHPVLTLCCFGFFLFSYWETKYLNQKTAENAALLRAETAAEEQRRLEDAGHFIDIKCRNMEKLLLQKLEERTVNLRRYTRREKILQYVSKYFGALNHDLLTRFFIYIVGGIFVIEQGFLVSSFLVFLGFYETFVKNVRAIMESNFIFAGRKGKLEKILEHVAEEEKPELPDAGRKTAGVVERIEADGITFSWPDRQSPVLRGCDFILETGRVYEIQGESGAGKSTLCRLLLGECRPTDGRILRNGVPVEEIPVREYLSGIRMVNADTKIFQGSVRSNLLMAREDAAERELWEACRLARLAEDVSRMPGGLDADVGESGRRLSGGQKERLAMARLFLTNPSFIILDEALAEVSIFDETEIYRQVIRNYPAAAVIIISHRVHDFGEKIRL